jgi:hypothetical protein
MVMDPIEAQFAAANERDLDRFAAAYVDDIVIEDGTGQVLVRGQAELRTLYGRLFAQSPQLHGEVVSRIRVGEYAVDEERITGANLEGWPTEIHSAVVYRLSGGKIVYARIMI